MFIADPSQKPVVLELFEQSKYALQNVLNLFSLFNMLIVV